MIGRPKQDEAADFYWKYINRVEGDDPIAALEQQLVEAAALFEEISEERSMFRYAPDKWSVRQVLSHVTDTERAFAYRALWFGRGFTGELLSFDDKTAAAGAEADRLRWSTHVEEFRQVRLATIWLFRNLPEAAWMRSGIVSGNRISVRALAFLSAGHAAHHMAIAREKYLG